MGRGVLRHLGREVVLARAAPGEVVYGAVVTLVTRSSLARLAEEVGARVDGARFRSTFELDGDDLAPMVERDWVGRRLRIGDAEVRVRGMVPRCAVIDLDPATGVRDLPLVKALARYASRAARWCSAWTPTSSCRAWSRPATRPSCRTASATRRREVDPADGGSAHLPRRVDVLPDRPPPWGNTGAPVDRGGAGHQPEVVTSGVDEGGRSHPGWPSPAPRPGR